MLALLAACNSAETRTERLAVATTTATTTAPSPQTVQTSTASSSTAAQQRTTTSAAVAAPGASKYAGIPQSKTEDGYYVLGDPNAPVVLTHYSDFL
jgi:protein-disulfide isomerase